MAYALGTMNKTAAKELRAVPRFALENPIRLYGSTLPLVVGTTGSARVVDGHVQNISSGGLCLLAQKRLKVSELLVGEIAVPGTRASIPTLLQVRWQRKNSSGSRYLVGLHFVLQGGITEALQTSTRTAGLMATGEGARRTSSKGN
ncbi:MAG: PilZ domain-containing protein [Terriglobia bacterium]